MESFMISNTLSLWWASKEHYKNKTPDIVHTHVDYFHYVFILGGQAKVLDKDTMIPVEENVLYMTKPGESHNFVATSSTGLFTIELKFVIHDSEYKDRLLSIEKRVYHCIPRIRQLLLDIIEEGLNKKSFYADIANLKLWELLLLLIRELSEPMIHSAVPSKDYMTYPFKDKDLFQNDNMFGKLAVYLHENLDKPISLEQMSKSVNISKGHLIDLFKKEYGMTPVKYLIKIRIDKAKEYLKASSYNVNEIAEMTGFTDSRYFSRVFKIYEQMTPTEYMEKYRKNLYIFITDQLQNDSKGINS